MKLPFNNYEKCKELGRTKEKLRSYGLIKVKWKLSNIC